MSKHVLPFAGAALAALLAVSACDVSAKDVGDASLRTLVAKLGASMFKNEKHPIDGELKCATGDGKGYTVTCTGDDTSGKAVRLVVKGESKDDVSSSNSDRVAAQSVVGTVDGTVVFSQKCLGSDCDTQTK